ncbi:MAG: 50S ribosomal protein L23 [Chlamydiales bacterium]|jgi:large subunit ribosomal protein L23|nr:50S ribosomal protein L23 [Chlamydiales bacterium]NCF71542.1 50S ribosomal protein L23 [Chlamydiales bacterium]
MTKQKSKSPYQIIKSQYLTEKSMVLQELQSSESNRCTKACQDPKYVFLVDPSANKQEIKDALHQIYKEEKIHVKSVNTINVKPKPKRYRGVRGKTRAYKKAVVTLEPGDKIESI